VIMTTTEKARELGIPESKWVYIHGGQDAHDHWFVSERADLADSTAIRSCVNDALQQAGVMLDQMNFFDFYSCFPCMPRLARDVLEHPIRRIPLAYNATPVTRHVAMRGVLARIAWMQGSPDEAASLARAAIEFAAEDSAFALCQTLVLAAIPIAIWCGDDAAAEAMTGDLDARASRYSLGYWRSWVPAFRALLQMRAGNLVDPPRLTGPFQLDTFATFAVEHLVPATIERAGSGQSGWHQGNGCWRAARRERRMPPKRCSSRRSVWRGGRGRWRGSYAPR